MKARSAFSIIELLLVVAIMAIMLTVSTSSLLSLRRHAGVRGGIDRYVAKHGLARATAIRMGRTAQLRADTVRQRLWVEVDGTTVGDVAYFQDGLRFRAKRLVLCFDPRGLATTGGASCESPADTVVFSHANRSDTLITTILGRVLR